MLYPSFLKSWGVLPVAMVTQGTCHFCFSPQMYYCESLCVSYGGLILILPCLPQCEVSWLDWKNTCYVFHMCRAITFTVRSLKYVGLPFSLPLPCNISWCTVLYVPRLPSTYSLQSAPSSIIKARNSLTGCRILLFQFSFDISPTLIMLLEILQTHWGLSVKICLLRGKRAFFVYLVRRTWAATHLKLAWKVSGSRILTQVSL